MSEKDIGKLIHDINSGLFSIQQAFGLIGENIDTDRELIHSLTPLAIKKLEVILNDWEVLKSKIK